MVIVSQFFNHNFDFFNCFIRRLLVLLVLSLSGDHDIVQKRNVFTHSKKYYYINLRVPGIYSILIGFNN